MQTRAAPHNRVGRGGGNEMTKLIEIRDLLKKNSLT